MPKNETNADSSGIHSSLADSSITNNKSSMTDSSLTNSGMTNSNSNLTANSNQTGSSSTNCGVTNSNSNWTDSNLTDCGMTDLKVVAKCLLWCWCNSFLEHVGYHSTIRYHFENLLLYNICMKSSNDYT